MRSVNPRRKFEHKRNVNPEKKMEILEKKILTPERTVDPEKNLKNPVEDMQRLALLYAGKVGDKNPNPNLSPPLPPWVLSKGKGGIVRGRGLEPPEEDNIRHRGKCNWIFTSFFKMTLFVLTEIFRNDG